MTDQIRRNLLKGLGAGLSLPLVACYAPVQNLPRLSANPFQLGVASGDPATDGFVLWTRLAPRLDQGGGMPQLAYPVQWEVATDEKMQSVIQRGNTLAEPGWGHSVHIEVKQLPPDQWYWYRFYADGVASPIGCTRTLPDGHHEQLRFALASCQSYESGYYSAYQHMLNDHLDLVIFVGDYIYESSKKGTHVREHEAGEPITLNQYRARYAHYKADPDLRAAHAAYPWLTTWDDHEVDNDYAGLHSEEYADPQRFQQRRRAAYQAYYEHMPLRRRARPRPSGMLLYQHLDIGDLAQICLLDNRQFRSPQACQDPTDGGGRLISETCPGWNDPQRTMLGFGQERWLEKRLAGSSTRWNIVAQQQLFTPFRQRKDNQPAWWNDDWNGYPKARQRLVDVLTRDTVRNPVVLSGDIHSFWVNQLHSDPMDPTSRKIAAEFVGTSITSHGPNYDYFSSAVANNPQVKQFESRLRGYLRCTVSHQRWQTDQIVVDDVQTPDSQQRILSQWELQAGDPELRQLT